MAIYTTPIDRQADSNFRVGAGYKLYFFDAGTTNARDTYTDNTYATPLANPVVADGEGRFSVIWTSGEYKVRLTDASDVLIWEVDNYSTDAGSAVFAESIQSAAGSAADVITANLSTTPSELTNSLQVVVELAHGANATTTPTFNLNSLGAKTIVRDNNLALLPGDTAGSGAKIYLAFSTADDAWVLINPARQGSSKRVVTASETYTPANTVKAIEFEVVGAGGGGGGTDGAGGGTAAASEAGGAGAYVFKRVELADIEASYTVTIGAAGSGGASGNNNGSSGGATTVVGSVPTISLSAGGGGGGGGDTGTSGGSTKSGANGGTATGGDINADGNDSGTASVSGGQREASSASGASFFGGAQRARLSNDGGDAGAYGAGGGSSTSNSVSTNYAGGDGGAGVVIITEFF